MWGPWGEINQAPSPDTAVYCYPYVQIGPLSPEGSHSPFIQTRTISRPQSQGLRISFPIPTLPQPLPAPSLLWKQRPSLDSRLQVRASSVPPLTGHHSRRTHGRHKKVCLEAKTSKQSGLKEGGRPVCSSLLNYSRGRAGRTWFWLWVRKSK